MPRSSRHKSSKHSSRDATYYSDSEKDSGLKERKRKEDSVSRRGSKDSASGEKRKYDSKSADNKDLEDSEYVEIVEEDGGSSTKKRKVKVDVDRWPGEGGHDDREITKNNKDLKGFSNSKKRSSRWDESLDLVVSVVQGKKSGSKVESKSERKDKDERDRKAKDHSKRVRIADDEVGTEATGGEKSRKQSGEERGGKDVPRKSGIQMQDDLENPESEKGSRHKVMMSSSHDTAKSIKYKDDCHKENRHKDKYRIDGEKDHLYQDEKQHRDGHHSRDNVNTFYDDRNSSSRVEKKDLDVQPKKSKCKDGNREKDRCCHHDDHNQDDKDDDVNRDFDTDCEDDHDRDRSRVFNRDREKGRYHDRDRARDRVRYHRERERDRDRGRELDHDQDLDHVIEKNSKYKEDKGRRRSPDADREVSASRRTRMTDAVAGSSQGRSPSSKSHAHADKYRDDMHDDMKSGNSKEVSSFLETPEKTSEYNSLEKHAKLDDLHTGYTVADRSSSAKASPMLKLEKSPSTSIDHKLANRHARRQSLDIDEAEKWTSGSSDVRDCIVNDDRLSRDMSSKKPMGEDFPLGDSSFYHKPSHGDVSFLGHGPPSYRPGSNNPSFMGSFGEEFRGPTSNRYRRSVDSSMGGVHGTPWNGGRNWALPISNGYMHFLPGPHGPPPHGSFPGMLPQFLSPPIFGVRPPLEMSPSGIPFHLPDMDRFPSHMRPLAWQNMVDSLGHSHFHGWDGNSSLFRDEPPFYGLGNISNGQVRESILESWKQNGGAVSMDTTDVRSKKDINSKKTLIDEAQAVQGPQESCNESSQHEDVGENDEKEMPSTAVLQKKERQMDVVDTTAEKTCGSLSVDNAAKSLRAYLCKLDISINLTDPVLYKEVVALDIIKQTESLVEEKVENMNGEKEEPLGLDILDENRGMKLLPDAEESTFQRAMDMYQLHSSVRRCSIISQSDGLSLPSSSREVKDTERVAVEEELKEEAERVALEEEVKDIERVAPEEEVKDEEAQPSSQTTDVDDEMNGIEEEEELAVPYPAEKGTLGNSERVSDPLILSHGSCVNEVCEAMVLPNNVSESVILSWIHRNGRESTH